jgi:hypothetical protein
MRSALAALFLSFSSATWAAELPSFDVDAQCGVTHGANNFARAHCVKTEQASYDLARILYSQVSGVDQEKCATSAAAARNYRYTYLYQCVSNARQMQQIRRMQTEPPSKFRP